MSSNYRPAGESSDEDYDDDLYGGFSFGDEDRYGAESQRPPKPAVVESAENAAIRRRYEADADIIAIIRDGTLAELMDAHQRPASFSLSTALCNDWSALLHAAYEGRVDMVNWLIANGAPVNQLCFATTALMAAAMPSDRDEDVVLAIVQALFDNGAILNVGNQTNRTAFMMLAGNGYERVVRYALPHVCLDACDNMGHTALFYAIEAKHYQIVRLLIDHGAHMDLEDNTGKGVRDWAIETGFERLNEFFPEVDEYVVPPEFLSMFRPEELAPTALVTSGPDVPAFFYYLRRMLIHMDCGRFEQNFADAKLSLMDFLAITDQQLEAIGIVYPFQRNRIRNALMRFHRNSFSPHVFRSFKPKETMANLFSTIAGDLKQLLIVEATIRYLFANTLNACDIEEPKITDIITLLRDITPRLQVIRTYVEKIHKDSGKPIEYITRPQLRDNCNRKHLLNRNRYTASAIVVGIFVVAGWWAIR